jgi:hypothetical protein
MFKIRYLPNDCKFCAWVDEGEFMSHVQDAHINFFYEIRDIIDSYIRLSQVCINCRKLHFCSFEDKPDIIERNLGKIYSRVIGDIGYEKVKLILGYVSKNKPELIYENFLISGLVSYFLVEIKTDIDLQIFSANDVCNMAKLYKLEFKKLYDLLLNYYFKNNP